MNNAARIEAAADAEATLEGALRAGLSVLCSDSDWPLARLTWMEGALPMQVWSVPSVFFTLSRSLVFLPIIITRFREVGPETDADSPYPCARRTVLGSVGPGLIRRRERGRSSVGRATDF